MRNIKNGTPVKVTRELTNDLLTTQHECVEAGHGTEELDSLSNEIFGEQADTPLSSTAKLPAQNSNQDCDLLNRAQRELGATQNLVIHLKGQLAELEAAKSTLEKSVLLIVLLLNLYKNKLMKSLEKVTGARILKLVVLSVKQSRL